MTTSHDPKAAARASSAETTQSERLDLEHFVEAFEGRVELAGDANISDFLPPRTHPEYHEIVVELVRVELEHRFALGERPSIEAYRARFPETFDQTERLEPVAFEVYRLRCQAGEQLAALQFSDQYGIDATDWPSCASILESSAPEEVDDRTAVEQPLLQPGESLLDFHVITEFGRGAFSRVYLAQQGSLANRLVVLKASRTFWNESDLLARLQHANIVPILSVHRHKNFQVVCMPFCGTCTLADVMSAQSDSDSRVSHETLMETVANHQNETIAAALQKRGLTDISGPMPADEDCPSRLDSEIVGDGPKQANKAIDHVKACLALVGQVADGLRHAHERGVIHSDLKPANILIADDGRPMILDFNLSLAAGQAVESGGVGGTLPYMAPEHLRIMDGAQLERRPESDIFSLGVVLFELLTGKKPFPNRDHDLEQMIRDREAMTPSVRTLAPRIPAAIDSIVKRALAGDTEARYRTAKHLHEDIQQQLANRPLVHAREPMRERISKWYRRKPQLAWGIAACALALLASIAVFTTWHQSRRADRAEVNSRLREFNEDVDWITSALGVPGLDAQRRELVFDRAERWLRIYLGGEKGFRSLSTNQRNQVRDRLGELRLTMADARVDEAYQEVDESRRGLLLADALTLNSAATRHFARLPRAAAIQKQRILWESNGRHATQRPKIDPQHSPTTSLGYRLLGLEHFRRGEAERAKEAFHQANSLSPRDYSTWAHLGNTHAMLHEFSDAERCFSICIALAANVPFGYFQRGVTRLETGNFRGAKADFDQYLKLHPDSGAGLLNRALAFRGLGEHENAIRDLTTSIDQGNQEPRLFLLRGELCHTVGDRERGARDIEKGLELVPTDERNWLARGMKFLQRQDAKQALADFRNALRCNPNSIAAMKNVAHVLSDHLEMLDGAIDLLDRAILMKPEDAELLSSRAVLAARAGRVEAARKGIQQAVALNQDAPTLIRAGCVFSITKQSEQDARLALQWVRKAIAKDPQWATYIAEDPDLSAIRDDERFQETINAARTLLN